MLCISISVGFFFLCSPFPALTPPLLIPCALLLRQQRVARGSMGRPADFRCLRLVWTGLEALGFGANLQHYNPLIDAPVAEAWNVPKEWKLSAQLVFGSPEGAPGPKEQKPVDERVKIYGKL